MAWKLGHWNLTDAQAAKLREFLLRGGFFMCDDFHGAIEWEVFAASMKRVFPDRPIVEYRRFRPDLPHHLRSQPSLPGARCTATWKPAQTYEKGETGKTPHWRAIYDDKGRIMVAMCHNTDLGDSWEHADNPQYPARFSDLGIRLGVNYIVYSMTH